MQRRNFIQKSLLASAALAVSSTEVFSNVPLGSQPVKPHQFNLKYAPHEGMFRHSGGESILDQLRFMAEQGFRAFEDNGMSGREPALQEKMGKLMDDLGIAMGVFVAHKIYWSEPNLTSGKADKREEFLADIRNAVEVAKRCNAKWMTVVPGHLDLRQNKDYQTAHVVESLKRAAEILEPQGLIMVLEPLNFRDHPGLFLSDVPQAYLICKAVNSPSCKILYDLYHAQIQHGNLIPNIDAAWDETAYFQIGDNPGRQEPTTGEINYMNVFKHIYGKGYTGILGMEHGNSQPGKEGEMAVIEAYKAVDHWE
ncbi:MAG: TIM barrel protein [Saprospiraceae bacterium]|nr:TIM barrel protein [Saprospiraceae bacterium]